MTVMLATFMEVLDTSVANVALPHIAGNLSATVDESTWVLTSYLVSNAIILPMGGWFSMLIGRKRFYMTCVALFTLASLACGLAPTLGALIVFRILQGVGGGALQPMSQAILVETFPREKHGMAMAVYGMGVVFAPIIGPTLGGWLTDNYSWRWIFLINLPFGILSLILTAWLVHDPPYLQRRTLGDGLKIDYVGFGLLAVGLGALEVVLDEGQREDWFSSQFIVAFAAICIFCLIAVVFWELRHEHPVIDFRILKDRNYTLATVSMLVLGFVLYGSTALLPLFLQTLLGYTALLSGLVLSPGGLVVLACMPLVGFLVRKWQPKWLVLFGVVVCSSGMFLMSRFTLGLDFNTAMRSRIVQSIGLAFLFVPISAVAFAYIPKEKTNYATGLFNLARNIGGSSGIAAVTTLLARRSQFHQSVLVAHVTQFDYGYRETIGRSAALLQASGVSAPDATRKAHGILYGLVQRQSAMLAFADAFWAMAVLFVAIVPLMLLMRRAPKFGQSAAAPGAH